MRLANQPKVGSCHFLICAADQVRPGERFRDLRRSHRAIFRQQGERLEVSEAALERGDHSLGTVDRIELDEDVADVTLHGCVGDAQCLPDLAITFSGDE